MWTPKHKDPSIKKICKSPEYRRVVAVNQKIRRFHAKYTWEWIGSVRILPTVHVGEYEDEMESLIAEYKVACAKLEAESFFNGIDNVPNRAYLHSLHQVYLVIFDAFIESTKPSWIIPINKKAEDIAEKRIKQLIVDRIKEMLNRLTLESTDDFVQSGWLVRTIESKFKRWTEAIPCLTQEALLLDLNKQISGYLEEYEETTTIDMTQREIIHNRFKDLEEILKGFAEIHELKYAK